MSLLSGPHGLTSFYLSRPAPCPYLPGKVEQKIFACLSGEKNGDALLNSALTQNGFRRSQKTVYRPACPSCMACVPVRIALKNFKPGQSLRRIARRNAALESRIWPWEKAAGLFELFANYQQARHAGSDMARMSEEDFLAMMQDGGGNAFLLCLHDASGAPRAAMLADRLDHGFSAVYSFFDPVFAQQSPGTELILRLAAQAQDERLDYLYLGYWIRDCRKMAYKTRFPALERLGPQGWEPFEG